MSQTSDPRIDIVTTVTALMALYAGGEIAGYAGPYIVITVSGVVGGAIYVQRIPQHTPRWQALGWVLLMTLVSVLMTAGVAAVLEMALTQAGWPIPTRYLLAPVAVGIAAVGGDWPAVIRWGIDRLPWRGRAGAANGQ